MLQASAALVWLAALSDVYLFLSIRQIFCHINFQSLINTTTIKKSDKKILHSLSPDPIITKIHLHLPPLFLPLVSWLMPVLCMKMFFPLYKSKIFISIIKRLWKPSYIWCPYLHFVAYWDKDLLKLTKLGKTANFHISLCCWYHRSW